MRLLVEVPPAAALSNLVQSLKGRAWLVSAVGGAPLGVAGRYVENQTGVA